MRNVFDQYTQPENRLTHALACTLDADRSLIHPFLKWLGVVNHPPLKSIHIIEQQVPGTFVAGEEDESDGLPDMCLFTDDGWAVLFECKVQAKPSIEQLRRHERTAGRCGYEAPVIVLFAVDSVGSKFAELAICQQWRNVYAWFRRRCSGSSAVKTFVNYMEVFESAMIAKGYGIRGTMTMFDGIHFSENEPYTYAEGRRLIRLLGDELQVRPDLRRLGVDPTGQRRGKITGRLGSVVWDFLPLIAAKNAASFTDYPHLTMNIGAQQATASVTVPNGIKGGFRTKLRQQGCDGFIQILLEVEKNLRPICRKSSSARPFAYALQRHFASQRSSGTDDARLSFDLRTISVDKQGVKRQPQWAEAVYQVLTQKRSNIQFGVSMHFGYGCKVVASPQAIDLFAESWIAMKPLLEFVME